MRKLPWVVAVPLCFAGLLMADPGVQATGPGPIARPDGEHGVRLEKSRMVPMRDDQDGDAHMFASHGRLDKRKHAIGGIVVAGAGYLASSFFDHIPMIVACRIFAGFGAGCAMAAANAMVAACDEPEQVYAWSFIVITAQSQALSISVMPYSIEHRLHFP